MPPHTLRRCQAGATLTGRQERRHVGEVPADQIEPTGCLFVGAGRRHVLMPWPPRERHGETAGNAVACASAADRTCTLRSAEQLRTETGRQFDVGSVMASVCSSSLVQLRLLGADRLQASRSRARHRGTQLRCFPQHHPALWAAAYCRRHGLQPTRSSRRACRTGITLHSTPRLEG